MDTTWITRDDIPEIETSLVNFDRQDVRQLNIVFRDASIKETLEVLLTPGGLVRETSALSHYSRRLRMPPVRHSSGLTIEPGSSGYLTSCALIGTEHFRHVTRTYFRQVLVPFSPLGDTKLMPTIPSFQTKMTTLGTWDTFGIIGNRIPASPSTSKTT